MYQTDHQHPRTSDPQLVAREVLERLEAAWNDGDGEAFGRTYAPDASFVTVRGEHIVGSAAIGAGHTQIFGTIYAGSANRMRLVRAIEVSGGIIVAVSVNTLDCPSGPLAGVRQALSTSVVVTDQSRTAGRPQILSTHNTLVTV